MSDKIQPIEQLTQEMKDDFELAWAWFANIAMVAVDAGADPRKADEKASEFMLRMFEINIAESERYRDMMNPS